MTRRGFTIVELIITITIMGILLTLAVVSVGSTQLKARDDKRTSSVQAIGNYLDDFYANGAPISASPTSITNNVTNPSFETGLTNWGGYYGAPLAIITSSTGCLTGPKCVSVDTSGGTYRGIIYTAPGVISQTGVNYIYSAYVKGPPGQQVRISVRPTDASYGYFGEDEGAVTYTLSDTWQRISTTPVMLAANTPVIGFQIRSPTANASAFYVDGAMATKSDTFYSYHDGSYDGWSWAGTAHNSISSGPGVVGGIPGSYPDVSITSSPLLTAYLPDADMKAFIAPGKSDPYQTFVPATNAVQTASGVLPQPTVDQFVYQPIDSSGNLCTTNDCRKYNIYYRLESDSTVRMMQSKNQ